MLARADHNYSMGSLSKQHEKTKLADLTVHFQRFEKCKFKKCSEGACPWTPLELLFASSSSRNTGHLCLSRNLQQASHSTETVRLESTVLMPVPKKVWFHSSGVTLFFFFFVFVHEFWLALWFII